MKHTAWQYRLMCLLAALLLCLPLLAACDGGDKPEQTPKETTEQPSEQGTTEPVTETESETETEPDPASGFCSSQQPAFLGSGKKQLC